AAIFTFVKVFEDGLVQIGLKKKYDDNIFFRNWVKKLTAIAIMPQERMDEAFQMAIECKPEDFDVQLIIDYFKRTWIKGFFDRSLWNHYESESIRTNDHVESYN
ncbi:unnamed protein product, partial [Brachionus calyciflorus]